MERRVVKRAAVDTRSTSCKESRVHHAAWMNPALWRGLPEELLQVVLARLPLAEVNRLRCLSKSWRWQMNAEDSMFKRVCAEAHPKLFALVSSADGRGFGWYSVHVYDMKLNRWHTFDIFTDCEEPLHSMGAADGGLVCFVVTYKKRGRDLPILVCNPLTQDWVKLPPRADNTLPRMVQLVMDPKGKSYKVVVVGNDKDGGIVADIFHSRTGFWTRTEDGGLVADLFHSRTGFWIRAEDGGLVADLFHYRTGFWTRTAMSSDLVFGYQFRWKDVGRGWVSLEESRIGHCAYDCEEGQLLELNDDRNPLQGASVKDFALVQDHLFVLTVVTRQYELRDGQSGGELPEYCISEFQGRKSAPYWIKLKDHYCDNFGRHPSSPFYFINLHGCKGFLLVTAHNNGRDTFKHHFAKLYDLSTGKWRALPKLPGNKKFKSTELMCELQWDAVP